MPLYGNELSLDLTPVDAGLGILAATKSKDEFIGREAIIAMFGGVGALVLLAFFVVLPLQYMLVGLRSFDLFSVFIPVYVFLAIPVLSALAGDPRWRAELFRCRDGQPGTWVVRHDRAADRLDFSALAGDGALAAGPSRLAR